MKELADAAGLEDAVVVNTCAVTGEAVRKARQEIRAAPREPRPAHRHRLRRADRARDLRDMARSISSSAIPRRCSRDMGGPRGRLHRRDRKGAGRRHHVGDRDRRPPDRRVRGRSRAYVQVQNGCDHRCTFCIIPYGRGNSRSVPMGVVVDQIKRLVDRTATTRSC
jgi:threonylcarbamoyladenosine tRNA methylthiotransferase MtaB